MEALDMDVLNSRRVWVLDSITLVGGNVLCKCFQYEVAGERKKEMHSMLTLNSILPWCTGLGKRFCTHSGHSSTDDLPVPTASERPT